MCGIFGTTKRHDDAILERKLNIASFRGPDHKAIHKTDKIILGHNRLSIFDLEERSNQPFFYENFIIVFNGEIYNFQELKLDLIKKGYSFYTKSDTEVVVAMYKEYKEQCLEHFIGMFSFVIYDSKENNLFGARDRLGQKPFFYFYDEENFEFSSSLKVLEVNNRLELNNQSCVNYFYNGYFLDPETPYKNTFKLEPGNYFYYSLEDKNLLIKEYWNVPKNKLSENHTYDFSKKELKNLLIDAVDIRLKADVPVGLFLSGGIDSSLISAISKQLKSDVNTYSIKFLESKFDESNESKEIAKYLGTNHNTFICDLNQGKDLIESFYKYYDEPFADVSALPSMLLSSEVSKHVTVALTGDGADEFFLGYKRYKWMNQVKPIYKIPYEIRRPLSWAIGLYPSYKLKMLAKGIGQKGLKDLYVDMMTTFKSQYIKGTYKHKIEIDPNSEDVFEYCSHYDIKKYLNGDINTKVDRASMAFSLETRSPFMDHRIVEFSRSIPNNYKYKDGELKYILKDILNDYIPRNLFDRPKKGFGVPIAEWFKSDLKDLVYSSFSVFKSYRLEFIDYNEFNKLIEEFYSNKANHSVEIWKMLMFVLWYERSFKS